VFGPPAEFAQWLADRHVEIIRVNVAACSRALYRSDVEGVSEWGASRTYRETTGRDMFADLVAELHQRGIKLCGDYNHFSNRYGDGAALRLPPAVDRDGRPSEKHYCWLSSDFAQRTRELVTELFIRYDLDALVIEDDHTPLCFCGPCIKGFKRFCEERGVVYADPRQMDPKAASPMRRLLGRYRALRYYGEIVAPMREIIHTRREGAKLGAWVGRWMREATNGYSRAGLAPFVDFEWHMAYVAPPGVADAVWSDLANISHLGTEEGAAMRPQDTADYTIQGLTAALEAGASVIGVYPEFAKTAIDPGYDGMAQVFARAEASWADRYERELASVAHVVVLGTERRLLSRQLRVLLTQRGFAVREARLDDDGRRLSELAPLIAQAHVVIAAQDVMLTDNDVVELERFVRAGGGLYLEPHALNSKPEFMGGDVVANSVPRLDADTWLKRFGVTLGDPVSVSWMSLRSVHDALRGVDTSPAVFGLCRRLTAMTSSVDAIGCDVAAGIPVLGAGSLGKGRIVCFGGVSDDALGAELLPRLCRWLSRTEEIRVTSRRVTGKRATAVFRNTGERSFTGFLGLALPRAASPVTVTCGGTMKEAVSSVTWGALRHVYVPAGIEPGRELEITVTADRLLVSD
jgi:hypothetical protein